MIKICLDAGHGGFEPGAVYNGYSEKHLNYSITNLLEEELQKKGFLTKMTRTTDSFVSLSQRAYISNEFKANYFVSIHCNAFVKPTVRGFEVYYYKSGEALANAVLRGIVKDSITTVRYTKQADFSVLLLTQCPAILVETGYMSNPRDLAELANLEHRKLLAKSIANSILSYVSDSS
jgi:N-acetylmuramoyl-L-alanine amidase